jgi:hypothetical protein
MRKIPSMLAALTALFLVFAGTAVSAHVAPAAATPGTAQGPSPRSILTLGSYSHFWTNSANDTLYIRASIDYDTNAEKGRLDLIVACYKGTPSNGVLNKCKLKGGTKVWENFTTGGTVSAPIGEQDNGLSAYSITGTWRSMVDSNSYFSRAKSIYVLFHGTGRTSNKHTVCSVPWSELYGTGAGPACSPA